MNESTPNNAIPSTVTRKMRLVRQRKLWVQVASAVVAAAAVLLVAMAIAMLIDWLATLYDAPWRTVLTTAAIATAGVTLAGWLTIAWKRGLRWERVASDVDRQLPQLEERWTTMARLGPHASNPQVVHPAMLRRVATEAAGMEPHVHPQQVVSLTGLGRAMVGLTAISAALLVAVMLDSHRMMVLMKRFWQPTSSISATELVSTPGNMVIGRGESLDLMATIQGTPVEQAMLFVQSHDTPEQTISLVAHGEKSIEFLHHIRSVDDAFRYRFRAGDGQTDWATVDVTDRPEIEAVQLSITPPAYTGQPQASFDKMQRRVNAMEKSEMQLAIRPTVPLKDLQLVMGDNQRVAMTAGADGWYRWTTTLTDSFTLSPVLTETHGLTNRRVSKMQVNVNPDRAPVVKVLSPSDQVAVRPDDNVKIDFTASDDVGIGSAELVIFDDSNPDTGPIPLATIPIDLKDQVGARKVDGSVNLDMTQFEAQDGARISYEVRVTESRDPAVNAAAQQNRQPGASRNQARNQTVASNSTPQRNNMTPAGAAPAQGAETPKTDGMAPSGQTPATPPADNIASNGANPTATNPAMTNPAANGQPATNETAKTSDPSGAKPTASQTPGTVASNQPAAKPGDPMTGDPAATKPTDATPPATSLAANPPNSTDPSAMPGSANPTTTPGSNSPSSTPGLNNPSTTPGTPDAKSTAANQTDTKADTKASATPNSTPKDTVAKNDAEKNNSETPRTVTSEKQTMTATNQKDAKDTQVASSTPSASNPGETPNGESKAADSKQGSSGSSNPPANSMANNQQQQSQPSNSDAPPPNNMSQRSLDVPAQASSSQRMTLKVDEWAGSFEGQSRQKLEIAIAPELAALDKALAAAQETSRGVLDELEKNGEWRGKHDRDMTNAERSTVDAQQVIRGLGQKTHNTPYAFVGLQLIDIGSAHVNPARNNFWTALQSEGEARVTNVHDGWEHVTRARQLLGDLSGQFQRAQKEFELAEKLQQVKKMYQVFIEDSFARLGGGGDDDPVRVQRKMAEYELDEEFLKGYREFMEKRNALMAELARILAEDPRLLQRYMNLFKGRAKNLREQLADLTAEQQDLNREVKAWTMVGDEDRPRIAQILLQRQLSDSNDLAKKAGDLQDAYSTWMPLSRQAKDPDLQATSKLIQDMATAANELNAKSVAIVSEFQRVKPKAPAAPTTAPEAATVFDSKAALADLRTSAETLQRRLTDLDVSLRQMSVREDDPDVATFGGARLADTRLLIAASTAWIRQIDEHKAGNYSRAAEVAQYRLAEQTDRLAGKLGDVQRTLATQLQRPDNKLPEAIAAKANEFMTALDKQVQPNQMAAVYALRGNQMPRANERQQAAYDGLAVAEKAYDEMIRLAVAEMDKGGAGAPMLPDDPTLDDLLRILENELRFAETLGIPNRPSNFMPMMDWSMGNQGGGAGGRRMMANQIRQQGERARRQLERSRQEAIARALKESTERPTIAQPKPKMEVNWNRLVSQLSDDLQQGRDKAPPEQYRRAIEQYFNEISQAVAEQQEEKP